MAINIIDINELPETPGGIKPPGALAVVYNPDTDQAERLDADELEGEGVVDSVFGRTGAVTAENGDYTPTQVGLSNVDNTSDADKPVSTAQQIEIDTKEDSLGNPTVDGHVLKSTIAGVRSWGAGDVYPYPYYWSTDTTDTDPGSGYIKSDGGDTFLYIDNNTRNGANIASNIIANLSNGAGVLIHRVFNTAYYKSLRVTGDVIDGTGYQKIPVIIVNGSGSFVNGEELILSFMTAKGSGTGDVTRNRVAPTIAANVLDIDFANKNDYKTTAEVAASANFEITLSNITNADVGTIDLLVTNTVIVTLPSGSIMQDDETRWTPDPTLELEIEGGTGSSLELSFEKVGAKYKWVLSQKFE